VAGIGVDEKVPGYKHVIFSPHPGGGLTYAKATFESMYGMIVSDWKIEKGEFVYEIEVAVSTTATVILPGADAKNVLRDGEVLSGKRGPELRQNNGNVEIEIGSGRYRFTYPVKEM
jgi:alpha-L-rhamnosidase